METRLDALLQPLQIPEEFSRHDKVVETEIIHRLEQWKRKADECLSELRDLVAREGSQLSVPEQALVISKAATFEGEGSWISQKSRQISKGETCAKLSIADR